MESGLFVSIPPLREYVPETFHYVSKLIASVFETLHYASELIASVFETVRYVSELKASASETLRYVSEIKVALKHNGTSLPHWRAWGPILRACSRGAWLTPLHR